MNMNKVSSFLFLEYEKGFCWIFLSPVGGTVWGECGVFGSCGLGGRSEFLGEGLENGIHFYFLSVSGSART